MAYFIVKDGSIDQAFPTLDEAKAYAAANEGARVIGDEWVTLGEAKDRVQRASFALDEVATMLDEERMEELRAPLREIEAMIDQALARLGLDPG